MRSILLALTLSGSLAFFAGCGGGDENSSSSAPSTSAPKVDADMLARAKGKQVFKQTCVACHGEDGKGIEGLGKNWTTSAFIAESSDDELVAFLKVGRSIDDPANTTGVLMPPRGGNQNLSNDDLRNVVLYMRKMLGD